MHMHDACMHACIFPFLPASVCLRCSRNHPCVQYKSKAARGAYSETLDHKTITALLASPSYRLTAEVQRAPHIGSGAANGD